MQRHRDGQLPAPKLQAGLPVARPAGVMEIRAEMTPPPLQGEQRGGTAGAEPGLSVSWDYSETIPHNKSPIICGGIENLLPSGGVLMEFWNLL